MVLKDLQATVYDLFGYLLPGLVALLALVILFWAILIPTTPLSLTIAETFNWAVVLIVGYILGHLVQAVGNLLAGPFRRPEELALSLKPFQSEEKSDASETDQDRLPEPLISSAKSKVSAMAHVPLQDVKSHLLYRFCDETVVQAGMIHDRDMYIYREGFYRGMAVSFLLLFLALVVRALVPTTYLNLSGTPHPIGSALLLSIAALPLLGVWLCFNRYRRFGYYKIEQAIVGFLVLQAKKPEEEVDKKTKAKEKK